MNVRDTVVFGPEILSIILSFVAPKQVLVLQRVCSTWKGIIEARLNSDSNPSLHLVAFLLSPRVLMYLLSSVLVVVHGSLTSL